MNENFKIVNDDYHKEFMWYMRDKIGLRGFIGGLLTVFLINCFIFFVWGLTIVAKQPFNITPVMGVETAIIGIVLAILGLGFGVWGWGDDKNSD